MEDTNTPKSNGGPDGVSFSASSGSAFELRGTSIYDVRTGKLICTVWPDRKASEERLMGESWLDMRERTEPERDEIERHTEERAAAVCEFLNMQNNIIRGTNEKTKSP